MKTFQYVYGRNFILETDHKSLTYIFGPKKGIPQMAASRVQKWAIFLAEYDFKIKGQDNEPVDSLSRIGREDINESVELKETKEHTYLKVIGEEV